MAYSFASADALNGYASGMQNPYFYDRIWQRVRDCMNNDEQRRSQDEKLEVLLKKSLESASMDLNLYLENEIRSYRIFCIYYFDTDDYKVFDYQQRNWTTEEEFNDWIRYAQDKNLIHSDVQVSSADHLLTMQSCKPYDPDQRVLVLCREVGRRSYKDRSSNEKAE